MKISLWWIYFIGFVMAGHLHAYFSPSESENLFRIEEDVVITAVDENNQEVNVSLSQGDHLSFDEIETSTGLLRVTVDSQNDFELVTFWISEESLKKLKMVQVILDDQLSEGVEVEDHTETHTMRFFSQQYSFAVLRVSRMTYCYRYVKKYLLKVGLVDSYLPGGSAYQAATILPQYGFKKVSRSPQKAIKHDVCVYKGGPSGHGHIEIMTSQGWYYGYGYKQSAIKNRIFISCFHK